MFSLFTSYLFIIIYFHTFRKNQNIGKFIFWTVFPASQKQVLDNAEAQQELLPPEPVRELLQAMQAAGIGDARKRRKAGGEGGMIAAPEPIQSLYVDTRA